MTDIVVPPVYILLEHDRKWAAKADRHYVVVAHHTDHNDQKFYILPDGRIKAHDGKFVGPGGKDGSLVKLDEAYEWIIQKTPKGSHIGTRDHKLWTFTSPGEPIVLVPQNLQTEKIQTLHFQPAQ